MKSTRSLSASPNPTEHGTMHSNSSKRSGQTGSVNVYLFLVVFFLFLGTSMFTYGVFKKNNEIRDETIALNFEKLTLDRRANLQSHYVEDLADQLKITGTYSGRAGVLPARYHGSSLDGAVDPLALASTLSSFANDIKVAEISGLEGLFVSIASKEAGLRARVRSATTAKGQADVQQFAVELALSQAQSKHSAEQAQLNTLASDFTDKYAQHVADKDNTISALNTGVQTKNAELADERNAHSASITRIEDLKNRLRGHNTANVEKLRIRQAFAGPDGRVIAAKAGVSTAFIDLGSKDKLVRGTVFRITNPGSGAVKAYGLVTRVEQERAEINIQGLADLRNPVTAGDQIHNDLFTPNVKRNIYLMGRFGYPYDRARIAGLLEALGNDVVESFTPGVDLVIIGQANLNEEGDGFVPVSSTDEYKNALNLGVQFAEFNQVRDLLSATRTRQ